MTLYKITSIAGVRMGAYEAVDEAGALDAMARDAGYANAAAAAEAVGAFDGTVTAVAASMPQKNDGAMTLRYIAEPTPEELEEAKAWIRKNHLDYEDGFDCAVHCCHDLAIFDFDEFLTDPRQDRAIAHFIDALTQSFYAGAWV
jgi:hypothetical protein